MNWVEPGERRYYGIDFVKEAKVQVCILQQHIEATQSRQKSYADKRRRPIEFEEGDYVYLKVSPMKGVQWFGVKRKLAPRYVGPYKIIERSGRVAYKLATVTFGDASHIQCLSCFSAKMVSSHT